MMKNDTDNLIYSLSLLLPHNQPIGLLFKTRNKNYFYDTPTNIILECNDIEYLILNNILYGTLYDINKIDCVLNKKINDALKSIITAIKEYNILQIDRFIGTARFTLDELKQVTESKLSKLTIEVTQRCNLQCGYCITNESVMSKCDISEEIAFGAIDYAIEHSRNSEELTIGFFGGEPLLKFELIKKCISYAHKKDIAKELDFAITTNATLITRDIAQELANVNKITIAVSIDGPQIIHDYYRKDNMNKGSHIKALNGLKFLVDAFGKRAGDSIVLSLVYTPPYSIKKLELIQKYFDRLEWLPNNIKKNISYPSLGSIPKIIKFTKNSLEIVKEDEILNDTSLIEWNSQQLMKRNNISTLAFERRLDTIINRTTFNKPCEMVGLNSCCIPGKAIYVYTNGQLGLCEQCHGPIIGDLNTGINYDIIMKKYLEDYIEISEKECSHCWLARLCHICYAHCFEVDGINPKTKNEMCRKAKVEMQKVLASYYESYQ